MDSTQHPSSMQETPAGAGPVTLDDFRISLPVEVMGMLKELIEQHYRTQIASARHAAAP